MTNNSNSIDEEIKYFNSILPKEKVDQKTSINYLSKKIFKIIICINNLYFGLYKCESNLKLKHYV